MSADLTAIDIEDATRITRSVSLLTAPVHDEIVMMDLDHGLYYGLDRIGADIWARIEQPARFGDLIARLAAEYDAEPSIIADDVRKFLRIMAKHKVVMLD